MDIKITSHSDKKTSVKTLKQNTMPKSKLISIIRHKTETELDAYDSGYKGKQKTSLFAIDYHRTKPSRAKFFFFFQTRIQYHFNFHNCLVIFVRNASVLKLPNYKSYSIT